MKTIHRPNNMLELSVEGGCLKELQSFACGSNMGGKAQVEGDLKRIYGLTCKDKLGNWSYIREKTNFIAKTQTPERKAAMIEPDSDEFFFSRIKSLDKKFQDFVLLNFHQGGMFYAARRFLVFHLNTLGFGLNSTDGFKHHLVCEFSPEKLEITENFSVIKLAFLPKGVDKIICREGELSSEPLEESAQKKIDFFQNYIKEKLADKDFNYQKIKGLQLRKNPSNELLQLSFNSEQSPSLMEFTVKHIVTLDPNAPNGIKIEALSKENVSLKVAEQLCNLSSETSSKPEFSKLLSPDLPYVLPSFFTKLNFKTKINESILNNFRDFILILFNIIFKLIFPPVAILAKASFLSPPTESYKPQNNFAYRMRA